jgi:hypothetical protein
MVRAPIPIVVCCLACGGTVNTGSGGRIGPMDAGDMDSACALETPQPNCPKDVPRDCPDAAPSYSASVAPLIEADCLPCHRLGGQGPVLLETYREVFKERTTILGKLASCRMPPPCATQPSPTERRRVLQWLVCGAPNN